MNHFINLTTEEKAVITAIGDRVYTVNTIEMFTNIPGDPTDLPKHTMLMVFGSSAFLRAVRGMLKIRERAVQTAVERIMDADGNETFRASLNTKWEKIPTKEDDRVLANHMSVKNPDAPGYGDKEDFNVHD